MPYDTFLHAAEHPVVREVHAILVFVRSDQEAVPLLAAVVGALQVAQHRHLSLHRLHLDVGDVRCEM